jgi:hypothetical protein
MADIVTTSGVDHLSISGVARRLTSFVGRNLRAITPMTLVLVIAPAVLSSLPGALGALFSFISSFLAVGYSARIAELVYADACGETLVPGRATRVWRRFGGLIGLSILSSLGVILGLMALVAPGIWLAVIWTVAIPAWAVEGLGASDALSRSASLTKGHRARILALAATFWAICVVPLLAYGVVAAIFESPGVGATGVAWVVEVIFQVLLSITITLLGGAGAAVIYVELRRSAEGTLRDGVAEVFG